LGLTIAESNKKAWPFLLPASTVLQAGDDLLPKFLP